MAAPPGHTSITFVLPDAAVEMLDRYRRQQESPPSRAAAAAALMVKALAGQATKTKREAAR